MPTPDRLDSLRQGWVDLLERYRVSPADVGPPFELLVAAYSAPDRHYHNLEHLDEMFQAAARLTTWTEDPGPVQLAIWFHDAVYDPRANDNEARSAELAVRLLLPIGVPGSALERVARLIATTAHLADPRPPTDRDTMTILDADLAILGSAPDRYREYAAAIRREYGWVPDDEYRVGRARVLEHFLARPRIYWHDLMHREREQRAVENMRAELEQLRK
jgi:predicted metal-dependent HD superfamily phosphohydrolase